MSGIICAVRGGPNSQPTIQKAIALAKETDIPIFFLYVVNMEFMQWTPHIRMQVALQEMREMGEFILLTAQLAAQNQGAQANCVVREGQVEEEIILLGQEIQADYVVLGKPQPQKSEKKNIFNQERLRKFSQRVAERTGAKVVFPS